MAALTLDSGALIALERGRVGMKKIVQVATQEKVTILVPANAVAEWWRGDRDQREVLASLKIVDVSERIAKLAGEALAGLYGHARAERINALTTIDATVIATASLEGMNREDAPLYTGDHDDMALFAAFFPNVRLFGLR